MMCCATSNWRRAMARVASSPTTERPAPDRSRHVYLGISLNVSEILRNSVFRDSARKTRSQRVTETVLEYVQVPGTAVLADHRL